MRMNLSCKAALMILCAAFTFSCTKQDIAPESTQGISQQVIDQFKAFHIDARGATFGEVRNPLTGEIQTGYTLEGDMFISEAHFQEMLAKKEQSPNAEQYRSVNLVLGLPRVIKVLGYNGGSFALTSKMSTALQWAINNYNALGLLITFTLDFGTDFNAYDMVVYKTSGGGAGGSAGLPNGGNPYKYIQIFAGSDNFSTNVIEHIITHEMGHCVGLVHTDWFNRSISCGSGGSSNIVAIHIPGTGMTDADPNFDYDSIMLTCFSGSVDGEFSDQDKIALDYLY
ncbi:MAG TPA: peptidase [Microscillaceae bacterium]|nr:peptidase [Microscillaceae bacterium]